MKLKVFSLSMIALLALSAIGVAFVSASKENVDEVEAYTASSLPTTIDLNPTTSADIREYYSDLVYLDNSEKTGTNLLKNLKPILKNGQKYYSYESGGNIWKMYEITDRDWVKSPASSISGYNSTTKIITGYKYQSKLDAENPGPFVHALYNNRDVDNQAYAWKSHGTRIDAWTIEREHVWPKSQGFNAEGAGGARGDPMHLMAAEGSANGDHSNHPYGYVDKTKSYTDTGSTHANATGNLVGKSKTTGSGTVFEPQDSDKGDIARAVFYMVARYNNYAGNDSTIDTNNPNLELVDYASELASYTSTDSVTGKMGIKSDLLEWNRLDPPDEYEIHRNDLLYTNFTNNRNPFIDFPDWAEYIWGNKAGNTYANPNTDSIHSFATGGEEPPEPQNVPVTGISLLASATIKVGESIVLSPEITPNNATDKSVTWYTDDADIATVSNGRVTGVAAGTVTISAVSHDGGLEANCEVEVKAADSYDVASDTLTHSSFTISGTGYNPWTSDVNGESGAVYNGISTNNNNAIQLNLKNDSKPGIVVKESSRKIKRISVEWYSGNSNGRYITIYGKNTAYSSPADLYSNDTKGDVIGTITYNDNGANPLYLDINSDYKYVGIQASAAVYLTSITFDWDIPVTSVSLDNESIQLDLNGDTEAVLNATVLPENATNTNISWSSSDEDIAIVDDGVITAKAVGETTITVTTEDGNKTANCAVTVVDTTPPPTEDVALETSIVTIANTNNWINATGYGIGEANAISLDENISFYTTGSGNNGKYYTNGNNWRLYHAGEGNITIKADNECTIKSVVLNFSTNKDGYLIDFESHTIEAGQSNDVNTSSVTYTVAGPDNGQVRITNISVVYETSGQVIEKALSYITVSEYASLFTVGSAFNFGGTVTAHFDNDTTQNVTWSASFSGYNMSETGTQTVTVSYTYKEVTKTTTYQITIEEALSSPYINGIKYKLFFYSTSGAKNYYFSGSMNGYYGSSSEEYADGVYVYFEQNGDGQNLYFMDNQTKKYISVVLNDTHYNFTISTETPASAWHYSQSYGCIYYVVNEKNYTIGTRDAYTTFSTFDVDKYPTNYKPQFAETAETFSYEILNMISCDPTGNTEPRFRSGYSWSDFKTIYNRLDETEQNILKATDTNESGTITEQAMAKYEYIAGKYHLENFIAERTPKSFPYRYVPAVVEENNILLAISIIVATSAMAIGLYALIAKKKRK